MTPGTDRKVAERYVLLASLGRGGMGEVWRARDSLLDREVAVKEIALPDALTPEEQGATKERVLREARAAARINHPNAVTVYDVLEDGGRAYIVMELIDAPTLADKVERDGPLDPSDAASVGLDVLGALEAAQAVGITHRDVKPGNVMLPEDGDVKLADFGIAAMNDDPRLTATGMILGSPSYMAPEQATSNDSGPASDLWSLGATLYFAVEGKPPFDRGQAIATLTAVVGEEPPEPANAGPLGPVIAALMTKDPSERPDPSRARAMLEAARTGDATTVAKAAAPTRPYTQVATPAPVPTPAPERERPRPAEPRPRPAPSTRSFPWAAVLGGLALVALLAALIVPNLTSDDDADPQGGGRNRSGAQANQAGGEDDSGESPAPVAGGPYEDPTTGYRIEYPEGWDVQPIDTRTDFTDPETGSYLRIDYTETPGPDAVAAAEAQSDSFGASHDCYEELAMEPTSMSGSDNAVLWEYSYCEGGANLHAYNLQFVLPDESYGFALNFQTHEEDWEASQGLWEAFKSSFVPPGG